jgi:uncharacterized protein YkwD
VDGEKSNMTAYNINGNNYIKLRDVGQAVGFNVYWDGKNNCVQVVSDEPYTGVDPNPAKPAENPEATLPQTPETGETELDLEAVKAEIIRQTNEIRREHGVAPLGTETLLSQAAQVRADEMAATTTFSHTRPDGTRYTTVTDDPYLAENIYGTPVSLLKALNTDLADASVHAWEKSEGHFKNMTYPDSEDIGVGLALGVNDEGDAYWYCVQLFRYKGYTITKVDDPILAK